MIWYSGRKIDHCLEYSRFYLVGVPIARSVNVDLLQDVLLISTLPTRQLQSNHWGSGVEEELGFVLAGIYEVWTSPDQKVGSWKGGTIVSDWISWPLIDYYYKRPTGRSQDEMNVNVKVLTTLMGLLDLSSIPSSYWDSFSSSVPDQVWSP